jgi:hypothetical protein
LFEEIMAARAKLPHDRRDVGETRKRLRGGTAIEVAARSAEAVTAVVIVDGEGVTTAVGATGAAAVVAEADTNKGGVTRAGASMADKNMGVAMRGVAVPAVDMLMAVARAEGAAVIPTGIGEGATSLGATNLGATSARNVTSATTERAIASVKNTKAPMSSIFKGHPMRSPDLTMLLTGTTSDSTNARRNRPKSVRLRKNSMRCSTTLAKSHLMKWTKPARMRCRPNGAAAAAEATVDAKIQCWASSGWRPTTCSTWTSSRWTTRKRCRI